MNFCTLAVLTLAFVATTNGWLCSRGTDLPLIAMTAASRPSMPSP